MSSLSNIVNVNVSRQTTVPSRAGFGTGAFISALSTFAWQSKNYSSYLEMEADSELGADALAAGAKYFGGVLVPTKLTVIKQGQADVNQVSDLVFSGDLIVDNLVTVRVDGGSLAPVAFDTDMATTLTAIAAAIQALPSVTTAVSDGLTKITVTFADTVAHSLSAEVSEGASQVTASATMTTKPDTDQTLTEALAAAVDFDNDWYALASYSRATADITEISDWVQAQGANNPKLYFAQSSDADILTALNTDIASVLKAAGKFRTSVWYHADNAEYLEMALMGRNLPTDPGSITWAYKSLAGITPDVLTSAQMGYATAKSANVYTTIASVNVTQQGTVSETGSTGEYIDVIRGVDWLTVNVQADLYTLLTQNPKLPYTSSGVASAVLTVKRVLARAQGMGILSTDSEPVVTAPSILDIPAADKAARTLNGLNFSGVLAGAIQKINVKGVVTL